MNSKEHEGEWRYEGVESYNHRERTIRQRGKEEVKEKYTGETYNYGEGGA